MQIGQRKLRQLETELCCGPVRLQLEEPGIVVDRESRSSRPCLWQGGLEALQRLVSGGLRSDRVPVAACDNLPSFTSPRSASIRTSRLTPEPSCTETAADSTVTVVFCLVLTTAS